MAGGLPTFPYNCYNDPWVNSLFQDAQPLAKGIFEGLVAQLITDMKALRMAQLELDDAYNPAIHEQQLRYLSWDHFTEKERALMPTILTIGGDGATYDIGFGALSRILSNPSPIKVLVLNTGVYSNTGGQASTSSFTGQDSDLSRIGKAVRGKQEARKELGIIASFHPDVFVCSTVTSMQGHFLKNTLEFLKRTDSPAVLDVYTPCQSEHGIADAAASEHARLAVESRMNPVFVHDPHRGETLHDWFSLEGNPNIDKTWLTTTLEYLDEQDQLQLLEVPLTPAVFALGENRFKKQFRKLSADEEAHAIAVEEYIDLSAAEREGKTPFVYWVNNKKRLTKLGLGPSIIELVEERRRNWHMLQYPGRQHVSKMEATHRAAVDDLMAQYRQALQQRESSLDYIAHAMAELAASSKAQPGVAGAIPVMQVSAAPTAAAPANGSGSGANKSALVSLAEEDQERCTDCKTCYQDMPELFEKTRIIVNGVSKEVAHIIPGALERIEATPEIVARIKRIAANCDAEIIQ